jgi:hypothetical protein
MDETECKQKCSRCLTYYRPSGAKVFKCFSSDINSPFIITLLVLFSMLFMMMIIILVILTIKKSNKYLTKNRNKNKNAEIINNKKTILLNKIDNSPHNNNFFLKTDPKNKLEKEIDKNKNKINILDEMDSFILDNNNKKYKEDDFDNIYDKIFKDDEQIIENKVEYKSELGNLVGDSKINNDK